MNIATITLAVHLVSLTILAGGGVGAFVMQTAVNASIRRSASEAAVLANTMLRYAVTAQLGAMLMLLSGLGLMAERHWGDWGHPWLMVKLSIFVILVLTGPLIARPAGAALVSALTAGGSPAAVAGPLRRLTLFHLVQKGGLVAIIVLAVLKPGV